MFRSPINGCAYNFVVGQTVSSLSGSLAPGARLAVQYFYFSLDVS